LAALEQNGIRCWIAPRDITPGMNWGASIVEAINQARIMVLVFSGNANKSPQIEREIERAVNRAITIIPMRIADITPERALEYFLSTPHWFDAFPPPTEKHLQRLAETIHSILASQYEPQARQELRTDARDRQDAQTATAKGRSDDGRVDGGTQQGRRPGPSPQAPETLVDAPGSRRRAAWTMQFRHRLIAGAFFALVAAGSAVAFISLRPSPPSGEAVFLFDRDQVGLPQSANTTIDQEAAFLRANPKVTVTVRAYCSDDEGARVGPKTLATLRAYAVRNALKARGISGGRVTAENACQTEAASAARDDAAAEAQYRRAVLIRN
jgi:outer membrane protein OmpA-like peptidoglycan-associated protein